MTLGGSGDFLAYAMSRRAQQVGAHVLRIPPFTLSQKRVVSNKDADAALLARVVKEEPELFYAVTDRDRKVINVRRCLRARQDAMKARIACEQRIRQRFIGELFCNEEGLFPEGELEKLFEEMKANDKILQALQKEEDLRDRALAKAVEKLEIAARIKENVEGVGPRIIAAIVGNVIDVRRFPTKAKFKAYCGVHVLPDGSFPRRRAAGVAER
jgi:transposase